MTQSRYFKELLIEAARSLRHLTMAWPQRNRALIVDPFFTGTVGHHLNFNLGLRKALTDRGWSVTILANRYASRAAIRETGAHRLLASPGYAGFQPFVDALFQRNADFHRSLRLLSPATLTPENLVIVHTATIFELMGLARWYGELKSEDRPRLIVFLQFPPSYQVSDCAPDVELACRLAAEAAQTLTAFEHVTLCTSSSRIGGMFAANHVLPANVPLPLSWPSVPAVRPSDNRLVFGFVGSARQDKGLGLLPQAIGSILDSSSDIDFVVQSSLSTPDARWEALSRLGPRVRVRNQADLARDDYYKVFGELDCVLLPYDPKTYGDMTSMIGIEAIGMGKGLITTQGTWLEDVASAFDAPIATMSDFSAPALVQAIRTYAANRVGMSAKVARAQEQIRRNHSVESFLDAVGANLAPTGMAAHPSRVARIQA